MGRRWPSRLEILTHLGALAAILLSAAGAGVVPATLLAPERRGLARALMTLALGFGVLSGVGLVLAGVGGLQRSPLVAVLLAFAGLGIAVLLRAPPRAQPPIARPAASVVLGAALLLAAATFALAGALAPEIEYDAVWNHLGFPARWLRDGGLTDFPCQYVSAYPFGTELLYGYGLDGPVAGKLVHFGFGVLLVLAVYDLGRRLFSPRAALAGAVVLATAPTVLWEATTAYVDLANAFFVVLALAVALGHCRAPSRRIRGRWRARTRPSGSRSPRARPPCRVPRRRTCVGEGSSRRPCPDAPRSRGVGILAAG